MDGVLGGSEDQRWERGAGKVQGHGVLEGGAGKGDGEGSFGGGARRAEGWRGLLQEAVKVAELDRDDAVRFQGSECRVQGVGSRVLG